MPLVYSEQHFFYFRFIKERLTLFKHYIAIMLSGKSLGKNISKKTYLSVDCNIRLMFWV